MFAAARGETSERACEEDISKSSALFIGESLSTPMASSQIPRLHLARTMSTALLLLYDELWVAAHLVRPVISFTGKLVAAVREAGWSWPRTTTPGSADESIGRAKQYVRDFSETLALLGGNLTATLVRGNPVSTTERNLRKWTRSTLFVGGVGKGSDQNANGFYPKDFQKLEKQF